ncbi:MAG: Rne/Rng family ribonuclease, partial [Planctomycetota bacterium]
GRELEDPAPAVLVRDSNLAPAIDESTNRRFDEAIDRFEHRADLEADETVVDVVDRDSEADVEFEGDVDSDGVAMPASPGGPQGRREMVINVSAGHECRIAILHEGRLEELFIERESTQSHVGNIYKGRITNVEASIQAVFVDFGLPKNGFLHISDVQPQYFPNHAGATEDVGRKIPRHHRPPIQRCFRRGQEVIVQITKEGVGTKGPTLSSYLSIPGRFLVMMPGMSRHGVSRKIEDEAARRQMRDVLNELKLPTDMGFILRTAGLDRSKRELQRDLNYLLRLWKTVVERIKSQPAPAELYRESDLVTRTIRDVYSTEFVRLIVDDAGTATQVREFLQIAMPRTKTEVELYTEREPLFHRMGIEAEIERINLRHVPLKSGGSLVIESTEALVAIDVNSGRFRSPDDAEETALRINMEAAEEIARQLRLRDLGGLIVCDFIDLRLDRNKRKVEQSLRDALKKHKERARISKISAFGLIEMTRQRQGPSIKRSLYADCPHCKGTGNVKMPESVILDVMRTVQLAMHHEQVQKVIVVVASDIAYQLLNSKRTVLGRIESETGKTVVIRGDAGFTSDQMECVCEDSRGRQVPIGASGGTLTGR